MIKCNYLGKKIGFSSSIIDLLNNSSSVVNGIKNNNIDEHTNEEDGRINNKKKQAMNKKNKLWGAMKHRKGEKITFCEELENEPEPVMQSNSSDIMLSMEKDAIESGVISPSKEIVIPKEKKKKKKQFF